MLTQGHIPYSNNILSFTPSATGYDFGNIDFIGSLKGKSEMTHISVFYAM